MKLGDNNSVVCPQVHSAYTVGLTYRYMLRKNNTIRYARTKNSRFVLDKINIKRYGFYICYK